MKLNRYTFLLLAGLFLFSCQDDDSSATDQGGEVTMDFLIDALPMQQVGEGSVTRSTGGVMDETFGIDAATRADKDADEIAIKSYYLVQFNGTAPGSTAVKSNTITYNENDNAYWSDFSPVNATCRVYIVANFNPNVANGTTLATFEKSMATYAARTTVDANTGIPMCGYQDFNPTTSRSQAPRFVLTAMVAKLTVTYTVDAAALADFKSGTTVTSLDVTLKNVASGTAYLPTSTPATAYRPTGVTFSKISVGKTGATYTFYVPENMAGNSSAAITDWKKRSVKNAPVGALYFEISGRHKEDKLNILIASFIGDPTQPNEFNIRRNYAYTLTGNITNGKTGTADERITMKPDCFNLNTDGEKAGYANCYIITDNADVDYGFDATVRGNNAIEVQGIKYNTLPDLATATEARVIWQTGSSSTNLVIDPATVRWESGQVFFTTTNGVTEGNAVIGLFASSAPSAPCLWSWHIWRLNGSAPSTVSCKKTLASSSAETTYTMMDRNLGAFNNTTGDTGAMGLLYQWGRKDPFPSSVGWSATEPSNIYGSVSVGGSVTSLSGTYTLPKVKGDASNGTELWAVQYPGAFIYANTNNDWLYTKNDNLWGTPWMTGGYSSYNANPGTKSIYDPCPIGYRVPPQDFANKAVSGAWNNGNSLTGVVTSESFWFPAAGRRYYSDGSLVNVASNGVYWSSSPNSSGSNNGGNLYFGNGNVSPQDGSYRAVGYSVRCVSEQ